MNELQIEKDLVEIKRRNKRVEADKAWETSGARALFIIVITYIIASLVMWVIGVQEYWLGALIPTVGFYLSTLSLPIIKRWWIKKYVK